MRTAATVFFECFMNARGNILSLASLFFVQLLESELFLDRVFGSIFVARDAVNQPSVEITIILKLYGIPRCFVFSQSNASR